MGRKEGQIHVCIHMHKMLHTWVSHWRYATVRGLAMERRKQVSMKNKYYVCTGLHVCTCFPTCKCVLTGTVSGLSALLN